MSVAEKGGGGVCAIMFNRCSIVRRVKQQQGAAGKGVYLNHDSTVLIHFSPTEGIIYFSISKTSKSGLTRECCTKRVCGDICVCGGGVGGGRYQQQGGDKGWDSRHTWLHLVTPGYT